MAARTPPAALLRLSTARLALVEILQHQVLELAPPACEHEGGEAGGEPRWWRGAREVAARAPPAELLRLVAARLALVDVLQHQVLELAPSACEHEGEEAGVQPRWWTWPTLAEKFSSTRSSNSPPRHVSAREERPETSPDGGEVRGRRRPEPRPRRCSV